MCGVRTNALPLLILPFGFVSRFKLLCSRAIPSFIHPVRSLSCRGDIGILFVFFYELVLLNAPSRLLGYVAFGFLFLKKRNKFM